MSFIKNIEIVWYLEYSKFEFSILDAGKLWCQSRSPNIPFPLLCWAVAGIHFEFQAFSELKLLLPWIYSVCNKVFLWAPFVTNEFSENQVDSWSTSIVSFLFKPLLKYYFIRQISFWCQQFSILTNHLFQMDKQVGNESRSTPRTRNSYVVL